MTGERTITLLLRVAVVCAVVVIAAITGMTAVPGLPVAAPAPVTPATAHVVVVGVPGLRWDDVDAQRTPALWRLLRAGSAGALSVRAAGPLTCPADGWVTLGAGNRGRGPRHGTTCPDQFPLAAPDLAADGGAPRETGARLPQQADIIARNSALTQGTRPGALADGVRCVTAVGRGAAVAAAHPSGRIDRYAAILPGDPSELLTRCPVTIVEGPSISDRSGEPTRHRVAAAADAIVARVDDARPTGSVLLVVGISDTGDVPRLHVAVAVGPGFTPGAELTSPTTGKAPFVQLMDLAPTAISALGLDPVASMNGVAIVSAGAQAATPAGQVARLTDHDRAAGAQRPLVQPFFTIMVVAVLALMLVSWWLVFRRWHTVVAESGPPATLRPSALRGGASGAGLRVVPGADGATGAAPAKAGRVRWPRAIEVVEVLAVTLATVPVAAFAANVVPWWRSDHPLFVLVALILAGVAALTGVAYGGPWRGRPTGPIGCVAIGTTLVLAADVLTGSNLQLNAVPGYSPLVAGRFTGFGNLAFGVYAAGVLIGVGCLAQATPGWRRPTLFTVAGAAAVLVVGAPGWGADIGGILALTPAVLLAAVRLSGRRVSSGVVAGAAVAALGAVSAFAAADYARPEADRSHLGRFVAQLLDGEAGTVIQRKAEANVTLLLTSQLTILVVAVAIFVTFVLLVPTARLRRVLGLYPAVRAGLTGLAVAAVLGFALNDSGVAVPAFAAMVAVPLAIALTIRVALAGRRPARRDLPVWNSSAPSAPPPPSPGPGSGGAPDDPSDPSDPEPPSGSSPGEPPSTGGDPVVPAPITVSEAPRPDPETPPDADGSPRVPRARTEAGEDETVATQGRVSR
ncbi:hypothetical protein [Cryptosporangium arvum]|uniref:Uncharacterized protein n=1 Tax=Cryptosporangium arvum DSM 44712 TaxID=927661 RepID=A0A010ZW01_9ACTN|nr:hypothetical protein [Cryptosporangium arvum]EXG81397.1 hypothetical protein CryarDRAFT_2511 [Cryptosporangium arvum DSM 44712]